MDRFDAKTAFILRFGLLCLLPIELALHYKLQQRILFRAIYYKNHLSAFILILTTLYCCTFSALVNALETSYISYRYRGLSEMKMPTPSTTNFSETNLLERWFPHATAPFIASAPMYGFTDTRMAVSVTSAGGYGMYIMVLASRGFALTRYNLCSLVSQVLSLCALVLFQRLVLPVLRRNNFDQPVECGQFSCRIVQLSCSARTNRVSHIFLVCFKCTIIERFCFSA